MRWGILVNLAVILTVSGFLLFLVFSASLERSALDARLQQIAGATNLVEFSFGSSRNIEELWRELHRLCRLSPGHGAILYGGDGTIIGECGARRTVEPPPLGEEGRRLKVLRGKWPLGLFRGITLVSDVPGVLEHQNLTARIFFEIPPSVFASAWKFFLAYLVMTQGALFLLGYILFHRTVIGPVREVASLASKAAGLTTANDFFPLTPARGDIQKISASLRSMIMKIIEDRQKMEALIEQLQKANRDLAAAQEGLVRSEKLASVGRLAAGIAHEIGNPLQIVMGYVALLRRPTEEMARLDVLNRMEKELERIHSIVRQLLDFARPIRNLTVPCDLNALIKDCVALVAGRKGFRHVTIHEDLDPRLSQGETDPEKVKQILVNLLFNAVDAIPPSGGQITFRSRRVDSYAHIEIEDTGVGIPPENLPAVFDPFFTTKEPGKGTGLGLAVCLGLAESLGGTLTIQSQPEQGTVVRLTLPIGKDITTSQEVIS